MNCLSISGVEDIAIKGRYGKVWAADKDVQLTMDKEYQCVWVQYQGCIHGIPLVALRRWEVSELPSEEQKAMEPATGIPVGQGQRSGTEGQREQLASMPKVLKAKG